LQASPTLLIALHDARKRAPASERDLLGIMSLGCVLQNMWFMATALEGARLHRTNTDWAPRACGLALQAGGKAMEVGTICQRLVFTIRRFDEVIRAAQLMREKHVGYLVVVELDPLPRPVGVLTDRDIVVGVVAREVDPKAVCVGDIMTANPITARESDSMETALQKMREFGVRRLPIVNDRRELVGIVAIDDVLKVFAGDAQEVVKVIRNERQIEGVTRP
jgi:CBS domain-containing protein